MNKGTMQKKIIGLSVISLLLDDLSPEDYIETIEVLCNKLVENNPKIKDEFIDKHALVYADGSAEYNQEEVCAVLMDEIQSRRKEKLDKLLSDLQIKDILSELDKIFEKNESATEH